MSTPSGNSNRPACTGSSANQNNQSGGGGENGKVRQEQKEEQEQEQQQQFIQGRSNQGDTAQSGCDST